LSAMVVTVVGRRSGRAMNRIVTSHVVGNVATERGSRLTAARAQRYSVTGIAARQWSRSLRTYVLTGVMNRGEVA
jgi:hypothetical protein